MPRFVILRHDPQPARTQRTHWDFMLESGDTLLTWALEHEPAYETPIDARQLADHRHAYLEYEGPISGDRGVVTRWDAGEFTWRSQSDGELVIDLIGDVVRGSVRLTRRTAELQRWVVSFSPLPPGIGR